MSEPAVIAWKLDDPLAQAQGESDAAHQSLIDYATMGPGRSQRKLWHQYTDQAATGTLPPTTFLSTIKTWSARFDWVARVKAKKEEQNERAIVDWDSRWQEFREDAWEDYEALLVLSQKIIGAAPSFVNKTVRQGRPRIIEDGVVVDEGEPTVVTLAFSVSALSQIRRTAHNLGVSALGDKPQAQSTVVIQYLGNIDPTEEL